MWIALGCTTSKLLQNWKQFTTFAKVSSNWSLLYNIKVITELKAIHNSLLKFRLLLQVVQHQSYYRIESNSQLTEFCGVIGTSCTTSKLLQNWKQFTTVAPDYSGIGKLYNIKVITELKAIHNQQHAVAFWYHVVQHQSYYRIESNSQQGQLLKLLRFSCTTSKLLQNWKQFTTIYNDPRKNAELYNIKVITELKAIHNFKIFISRKLTVVQHQSYYRIESNSQREAMLKRKPDSCTTSKLLQNWKQFTTQISKFRNQPMLYNIKVITELKAIHNWDDHDIHLAEVVQHQSYYRIESNSQHDEKIML